MGSGVQTPQPVPGGDSASPVVRSALPEGGQLSWGAWHLLGFTLKILRPGSFLMMQKDLFYSSRQADLGEMYNTIHCPTE